jgi:transcriptional regulator with XRE-family HTH domain
MNNTIDVGRKIKEIRAQKNLSQDRFGKKIGKTGKTICAYERGRCTPPLKVLEEIAQVYDATFMSVKQSRAQDIGKKIQELKDILIDFEKMILR